VDAPVGEPFRAPAHHFAAGNRGVDYAAGGATVRAAAGGQVSFAGPVAGRLVVVVLHPDRIRTTYDGLVEVQVQVGDVVQQGDPVGTAAASLHFGARAGTAYLDPEVLFAAAGVSDRSRARLVPVEGSWVNHGGG
jgi:murein DD-endopeptidase MepM/ murein hydrolase activator NlpD